MKYYSSVYTIAFTVEHDEKDGSDVTKEMLIHAVLHRVGDLATAHSQEWMEVCEGPEDTAETY